MQPFAAQSKSRFVVNSARVHGIHRHLDGRRVTVNIDDVHGINGVVGDTILAVQLKR
jgi:hypothetical protein